jgi:hypothetical protein
MPQVTQNLRAPQIWWFNPAYPTTQPTDKPAGPSKPNWPSTLSDTGAPSHQPSFLPEQSQQPVNDLPPPVRQNRNLF